MPYNWEELHKYLQKMILGSDTVIITYSRDNSKFEVVTPTLCKVHLDNYSVI